MSSAEKRDKWKIDLIEFNAPPIPEDNLTLLKWLLDELIKISRLPHPNIRQSVCVYLLSIVKRLSSEQRVRDQLSDIQNVFMELLSENNGNFFFFYL